MRKPTPKTDIQIFRERIPGSEKETERDISADYVIGSVDYDKGGMNYSTYKTMARGYRLRVAIRTQGQSKDGMFQTESFMMFGGINKGEFIEEAKMFSAKRLQALSVTPEILVRLQNL